MANVPKPNIIWRGAHPNNFTVGRPGGGRNGQETFHHVVGSAESAVIVFNNPSRGASSHFVVTDQPGVIFQCVDLNNTAWTDGNWASNLRAVTVEHHGDWRNGYNNPVVAENAALLCAWLRDQGIVTHPVRHRQVSDKATVCPADLPVEAIWNRATQIIQHYNTPVDNRPQWLKDRKPMAATKVYSHKDGLFLRNLNDPNQPVDTRRWGINQDFDVTSYTIIGGKKYYITKSSTDTNAPNGLLEGEVKLERWSPPAPQITQLSKTDFNPARKFKFKTAGKLLTIPGKALATSGKVDYASGEVLETVAELSVWSDGSRFYRTAYSVSKGIMQGFLADVLEEVVPEVPTPVDPVPTAPAWLKQITEEPKRTMYVLRATPLIDLENGHPYVDPKTGKEVWFAVGDIVENLVAHVDIEGKTYRLTEWAYGQTKDGKWQQFANGINSDDLSTDPLSTPPGTPANPDPEQPTPPPSSGSNYLEELNKNVSKILELLKQLVEWVTLGKVKL